MREDVMDVNSDRDSTSLLQVQVYDLQPGDRVLLVNGGVQHNVLTKEMEGLMNRDLDDVGTERMIQAFADRETGAPNPRGRAEAADVAAVVYTVSERRRTGGAEKQRREHEQQRVSLETQVKHHEKRGAELRLALHERDQQLERLQAGTVLRDRLRMQIERTQLAQEEANHRYQAATSKLSLLDTRVPPRLSVNAFAMHRPNKEIADALTELRIQSDMIHAERTQAQRDYWQQHAEQKQLEARLEQTIQIGARLE